MYKLYRIVHLNAKISEDWTSIDMKIDNRAFFISNIEMESLLELSRGNEYHYYHYNNVLQLDRAPHCLEGLLDNQDLYNDYLSNLNNKHYVSYYYTYLGDDIE